MIACEMNATEKAAFYQPQSTPGQLPSRVTWLHVVTAHDLNDLRDKLRQGQVPPDLEAKLQRLAGGNLTHRVIEHNCRAIIALLQAVQEGSFKESSSDECERLLRVLAYVRKDEDAIADYREDGFTDDQQELRTVVNELSALISNFKSWRLRHQVPGLWR